MKGSHQCASTKGIARLFHHRTGMKPILSRIWSIPINKENGQIIPWPDGNETNCFKDIINSYQQREWADYSMTGWEGNQLLGKGHPFHSSKEFCRIFLNRTRMKPIVSKGNGQNIPWPVGNEIYPRRSICFRDPILKVTVLNTQGAEIMEYIIFWRLQETSNMALLRRRSIS